MPFALVTIGMLLIITGFQDTYKQMGALVASDFTGKGNFFYWIVALGIIGALGYNKELQPFSRAFMALIIVGMFLSKNSGVAQGISFFNAANPAIDKGTSTSPLPAGGMAQGASPGDMTSGSSGGGFDFGNIGQDVSLAATVASFF